MSNITFVTALVDIKRGDLTSPMFKRSFQRYLDNLSQLVPHLKNHNLIIFAESENEEFIRQLGHPNIRIEIITADSFRETDYYALIQKIRTNPEWYGQVGWLRDSTQASLELYNPLIFEKIHMLDWVAKENPFGTEYFVWIDAGIANAQCHPGYFSKPWFEERIIPHLNDFLFICFPYEGHEEIHGFRRDGIKKYVKEEVKRVARATFFGGRPDEIDFLAKKYKAIAIDSLERGYMGTEESIFTILSYRYPNLINNRMISGYGLVGAFFEDLQNQKPIAESINTGLLQKIRNFPNKKVDPTIITDKQLDHLVGYLLETLENKTEGDVVEFGCYVGESSKYLAKTLLETGSQKQLYLYDSFEGLPDRSQWEEGTPWKPRTLNTTKEVLESNFKTNGLPLPVIHKDWFKNIPDEKIPDKISFAFLDGDFFESIYDSLNKVYHRLSRGAYVCIHDYDRSDLPGVRAAVEQFARERNIVIEPVVVCGQLAVFRKEEDAKLIEVEKMEEEKKPEIGGFIHNEVIIQQHRDTFKVFDKFFEQNPDIKTVIELGSAWGGLTMYLKDKGDSIGAKVVGLERSPGRGEQLLKNFFFKERNIDWRERDIFAEDTVSEVKDLITKGGRTLVLCDGGNKVAEFNLYSKFLKPGDVIMAHDYAKNVAIFESEYRDKIWNWHEIQDSDIQESVTAYQLEDYFTEFNKVVWVCKIKTGQRKTDLYVITYNSPIQFKAVVEAIETSSPEMLEHSTKWVLNNSTDESLFAEYETLFEKWGFNEIREGNLGICGGRQYIAEHFAQTQNKYMFFFEDDMFMNSSVENGKHCKNGFPKYYRDVYQTIIRIMDGEGYDFIKMSFTEFFGDNSTQWSWYNVPQEFREKHWEDHKTLPKHGLHSNPPRTRFNNIKSKDGLSYADGEVYYCNWPQIISKLGSQKIFLDLKWAHPAEQAWMANTYKRTIAGEIKPAILLASLITHDRFDHYKTERKES